MLKVFEIAARDSIPSFQAADRLAEERIAAVAKTWSKTWTVHSERCNGASRTASA